MNCLFKKFHDIRVDNDLTQQQLANIFNIPRVTYCNYERGRNLFPLKLIVEFANYFDLSLDYLFNISNIKYFESNVEFSNYNASKRLYKIRKESNLSQKDFAKLLNLPQRTYASYENNERAITIEVLLTISKLKNISLDYLTTRSNDIEIKF